MAAQKALVGTRPEDKNLGVGANLAYGFQHVLTMYGGLVAVPLIIGEAAGLSAVEMGMLITASLFAAGVATLIQTLGFRYFGSQLPLVQGVSFAGVASMLAIINAHPDNALPVIFGAVIVSAFLGLLITPFFSKILRFFPPVVAGVVVTSIGLSLMPVAAFWAMGGNPGAADFGSIGNITMAAVTLLIVLLLSRYGGATAARLSILIALVVGTIIAAFIGLADFSAIGEGPVFELPTLFHFGAPVFDIAAIVSMFVVIIVTFAESTADMLALGDIVETEVDASRLADGLRADMLSSILSPFVGSFTQSAFAQNVGLVAVTGVKSRYVVAFCGLILIALGLLPIGGRLVACLHSHPRARWRWRHPIWQRGGSRHPRAVQGGLSRPQQSHHRGGRGRRRHPANRCPELLLTLPGLVLDDF